jgi:uncharacterized membrane protein
VPVVVANLAILLPAACRQVEVRLRDFIRAVAVAPAVGAVIAALTGVLLRRTLPPQSIPGVIVEGAAVGVAYLAAVWLFGFDEALRARYAGYARHAIVSAATTLIALTRRARANPVTV